MSMGWSALSLAKIPVCSCSPECFGFYFGFALHPVDYLRAKDDFEILFTPVGASVICQLFQVRCIG